MRIIAGEFRRRLLKTPPDDTITRPIPDRVKESLFGMLSGNCVDANVFDAFAGTGAIGLEAVSRGAARVLFIERETSIARLLQSNIDELGVGDRCEVMQADALGAGALARAPRPLHLAFLDPPYPLVRDPLGFRRVMAQAAALIQVLEPDGFLMLRLPHPLLLGVGDAPPPVEEEEFKPRRGKFRKEKKRTWREEQDDALLEGRAGAPVGFGAKKVAPEFQPTPSDDEALELGDFADEAADTSGDGTAEPGASEGEASVAGDEAAPKPEPVPADLHIPGADGPETHVYHGMAIHLYARAKA